VQRESLWLRAQTEYGIPSPERTVKRSEAPKGKPQPEDTMSLTQSVAQMLRERVTLEVESIDRLVRRVSGRSRA